jgi:hypothetical protein
LEGADRVEDGNGCNPASSTRAAEGCSYLVLLLVGF